MEPTSEKCQEAITKKGGAPYIDLNLDALFRERLTPEALTVYENRVDATPERLAPTTERPQLELRYLGSLRTLSHSVVETVIGAKEKEVTNGMNWVAKQFNKAVALGLLEEGTATPLMVLQIWNTNKYLIHVTGLSRYSLEECKRGLIPYEESQD
jgi:hypothetical protein